MASHERPRPFFLSRLRWNFLLSVVATATLGVLLFSYVPHGELVTTFRSFSRESLALYGLISVTGLIIRATRYRVLLEAMPERGAPLTFTGAILVTGIRNAFVDFLPARLGEIAYFLALKRLGISVITAGSTWALCIALDIVVLAAISLVLFTFFLASRFGSEHASLARTLEEALLGGGHREYAILASITFVVVMFLLFLRYAGPVLRILARVLETRSQRAGNGRRRAHVARAGELFEHVARDLDGVRQAGRYGIAIMLTVLLRGLKYGSLYLLLLGVLEGLALKVEFIHPFIAFSAFLFAESSASLPAAGVMGFGTYEAVWALVFSLSRVEFAPTQVLAIAFSIHVITQLVAYTIGLLCVPLLASYSRETP